MKRLYISADMEGIAGVMTRQQLVVGGFEYQQARQWMTDEVNAVCNSAFESGIEEVVVADSHSNGQNILVEQLVENVQLIRSWPRPLQMMQGVEETGYVGAILLGYHGGAHVAGASLAHTVSLSVMELSVNGEAWSEAELSAAIAGYYQVPIIMASGDDIFVDEVCSKFAGIETVTTQKSYSGFSGKIISPKSSQKLLQEATSRALNKVDDDRYFSLFVPEQPLEVNVKLNSPFLAETLMLLKQVTRIDSHTINVQCDDVTEIAQFFSFLSSMETQGWKL